MSESWNLFSEMSRKDARLVFDRFVAEMPTCLDRFKATLASVGVDPDVVTENRFELFDEVWSSLAPLTGFQPLYQPPDSTRLYSLSPLEGLRPVEDLPTWFQHPSGFGWARFSRQTLWLVDGMGRWFGQAFIEKNMGAKWALGSNRNRGYHLQNQPVLRLARSEWSPFSVFARPLLEAVGISCPPAQSFEEVAHALRTDAER